MENGGKAPRILSLDNYFITEVEKKEKDPVTGAQKTVTSTVYEYDEEREPLYRAQLVRQFKKTIEDGSAFFTYLFTYFNFAATAMSIRSISCLVYNL